MCWSFLPHVRFLILLTVFQLLPKTCNFTICSIFSNSGHVGWCTASPDTILKLDTLVMIQTKFGFHWSSTFRFLKKFTTYDGRRTTTTSDGNSSHDPFGSGELKRKQAKHYVSKDNFLYYVGAKGETRRVVSRETEKHRILRACHSDSTAGKYISWFCGYCDS